MGEFLQSILLSDFMIFVVMGVIGLIITFWAFSAREYAGYALGWLVGIFIVMLFTSLFPRGDIQTTADDIATNAPGLTFFSIVIPGMIGVGIGFGTLSLISLARNTTRSKVKALVIALLLSLTLSSGYLMLLTTQSVRLMIAIFILAVAIGALFQWIIARRSPLQEAEMIAAMEEADIPPAAPVQAYEAARPARRFPEIRRRFGQLGNQYRQPGE